MTMIMATHQIGFASSLASEIIFMEDGRILERGTPDKIFNQANTPDTGILLQDYGALRGDA